MPLYFKKAAAFGGIFLAASCFAQTYTNKGLVGYAFRPADSVDAFGDTLGGIGSAIAISPGSFSKNSDGTFSGRLIAGPDRGHNTQGTVDYFSRHQIFDFVLNPYYGDAEGGANGTSLYLRYSGGLEYIDTASLNQRATGLDPTGVRPAVGNFPALPIAGPNNAVCIDQEGIAYLADGSFFISDEYGPYIYHMSATGVFLSAIQPPAAIVPLDAQGNFDFTSASDPATGRVANQGFEALTVSPDNQYLYATLQSATVQDGGSSDFRGKYTRMVQYDISNVDAPILVGEYVVELPTSGSGQARAQSEMYYLSSTRFLLLVRDGDGNGNGDPPTPSNGDLKSGLKNIGYFDISAATNIAGTTYDEPSDPVAPGGVLVDGVIPAVWQEFLDVVDDDQLAKAGLHNGAPQLNDIVGKYESIALASVMDPEFPDDYFVFTLADNDFITANGIQDGIAYADPYAVGTGFDVPNQFLVFRVTLPGATIPSYLNAPTLTPSGRARARARRSQKGRTDGTY